MTPNVRWVACEHPERPPDQWVSWHRGCSGCAIKADAWLHAPDDPNGPHMEVRRIIANVAALPRVGCALSERANPETDGTQRNRKTL